jgi:hypothetical protein
MGSLSGITVTGTGCTYNSGDKTLSCTLP